MSTDADGISECTRCNATMSIDAGCEPTEVCHQCAQEMVEQLTAELAEARKVAGRIAADACGLREESERLRSERDRHAGAARHHDQQAQSAFSERDAARRELGQAWAERDEAKAALERTKAELAEAQENERRINREREALCRSLDDERAAHERTKAELEKAGQRSDGWMHRHDEAQSALAFEASFRKDAEVERDAAQADAATMRDWCAAWLIRARMAIYREGWELGMSQAETSDALTAVLFNLGCDEGSERTHDIAETKRLLAMPITYAPPAGRALAERVTKLGSQAKLNDLRRRCAVALLDEGEIDAVHEDGCPEDDTCDCPLMPLVHAMLNDDKDVDVAAAEGALAALDAKEQG